MAVQPEELFGDATSQTPNLRAYPYEDGIAIGQLEALASDADVAHLTPLSRNSDGTHRVWSQGVSEVSTITADATPATDGTFTLTVDGATTAAIDHDAAAAAVQAALEALPNVSPGDVAAVDSGGGLGSSGGVCTLTWGGDYQGLDVDLSADFGNLTGNTHVLAEDTAGSGGSPEIDCFLWAPDEAHAGLAAGETLIQRFVRGILHRDDVPLPAGESQSDLDAALQSMLLRQKGVGVQGLDGVA